MPSSLTDQGGSHLWWQEKNTSSIQPHADTGKVSPHQDKLYSGTYQKAWVDTIYKLKFKLFLK